MYKDYSGSSLMMGSIRGRRFFSFTTEGELDAPIHDRNPWIVGGENVARCPYVEESHSLAACSCGFYANLGDLDRGTDCVGVPREYLWAEVVGVIEGYGETLIGSRGFRCGKAKILGIAPSPGAKEGNWLDRLVMPYIGSRRSYRFKELKEAFPEVPVFKTADKLFRAFPVSSPEEFTA